MFNKVLLGLIIGFEMVSATVEAKDLIKCQSVEGSPNGGALTNLRVYEDQDGSYGYEAAKCVRFHGTGCLSDVIYESAGLLEREYYNGSPTAVFKNESVEVRPSFAGSRIFLDRAVSVQLFFMPTECEISID